MNPARPCSPAHGLPAMDYFHADRRPVRRRSPGGRFPAPSNTGPWRCPNRFLPCHGKPSLPRWPIVSMRACGHPGEDAARRRRTGVGPDQYRLRPGLEAAANIPSFIHISDGKLHDVHALLLPEAGAIVVDRGYVDFARLYVLHQAGAFAKTRCSIRRRRGRQRPDHLPGRLLDYPELRRIRFKDPESGKTLVFITNNFSLPAATICAL